MVGKKAAVIEVAPGNAFAPAHLKAECAAAGRPMVFRNLVANWPATKWNLDQIAAYWPRRAARASFTSNDGLVVGAVDVPAERLVREVAAGSGDSIQPGPNWHFDLPRDLPELSAEFSPGRVLRGRLDYHWLFIGRDTTTCTHYHTKEHGVLCQVHGTKRVVLYPPEDTAFLYPYPVHNSRAYMVSRVDWNVPDFAKFPKARKARPMETTLRPGDALFIPLHWWHAVHGSGPTLSIALFWNARLRDYRFPQPSLRTFAAISIRHGRAVLGLGRRFISRAPAMDGTRAP